MSTQGAYVMLRTEEQRRYALRLLADAVVDQEKPSAVHFVTEGDKRSSLQNAYLWGWLYAQIEVALKDAGIQIPCKDGSSHPYTKDVLHEIFKNKFLVLGEIEAKNGSVLPIVGYTTQLSKKAFCEYCDNVGHLARDFWNITVPPTVGIYRDYEREIRGR